MKRKKKFDVNYFIMLIFLLVSANANILSSTTISWAIVISGLLFYAILNKLITRAEVNASIFLTSINNYF
jgi:hypothetical protein